MHRMLELLLLTLLIVAMIALLSLIKVLMTSNGNSRARRAVFFTMLLLLLFRCALRVVSQVVMIVIKATQVNNIVDRCWRLVPFGNRLIVRGVVVR